LPGGKVIDPDAKPVKKKFAIVADWEIREGWPEISRTGD